MILGIKAYCSFYYSIQSLYQSWRKGFYFLETSDVLLSYLSWVLGSVPVRMTQLAFQSFRHGHCLVEKIPTSLTSVCPLSHWGPSVRKWVLKTGIPTNPGISLSQPWVIEWKLQPGNPMSRRISHNSSEYSRMSSSSVSLDSSLIWLLLWSL